MPTTKTEMKILECKESYPMNATGGLYVSILRERGENSDAMAKEAAKENGYKPDGRGMTGLPTVYGITNETKAYWFYEKVKEN